MLENIDFVQRIVMWLEDNQIFSRERKSNEQRALGMLLYYAGLSYEKAGSFVHASVKSTMKRIATFCHILYDADGFKKISATLYA